uniref:Uncharacterized protein n=1 Tax=viral metagenome TaxID=1070528 RepID=A0A6C0JU94_9ZZZZ
MVDTYIIVLISVGLVMLLGGVVAWSYYQFDDLQKKKTGMGSTDINQAPGFHEPYRCATGCQNNP